MYVFLGVPSMLLLYKRNELQLPEVMAMLAIVLQIDPWGTM